MPLPDDIGERKISRRRYIRWAGVLVAAGVVGLVLGEATGQLPRQREEKPAADPVTQTSTTTITANETQRVTNTQVQTVTDTQTITNTELQTLTATETQTVTGTETETETETVTDTQVETQTVTASATSSSSSSSSTLASPATNPFSIFWITDTQFLSESNPALFSKLTKWIVDNWQTYNGKMVIHTGDLVQIGGQQVEWENADAAMSVLLQNGIPYTWCAGNHDDLVGSDATSGWKGNVWSSSFNPSIVASQVNALPNVSWVSDFHDGMNTAASFSANGLNFLVINIEWNAQPDVLKWVGEILDDPAYADHYFIIAPHAYVNAFGLIQDWSNYIDLSLFVKGLGALMNAHSSKVFLTLNGHYATDYGYNTPTPVNGRNQLMFDRQDCTDRPGDPTGQGVDAVTSTTPDVDKVGGATVTILTLDTQKNQLGVSTYDVHTGKWRDDVNEQYSLTMFPNPLPKNAPDGNGSGGLLTVPQP
ncbi:MAG: metallophosphoesterase [Thaumarchaeota archaeon]|nr:metallophosphoesterase [Nitrososphaerota archaeon]